MEMMKDVVIIITCTCIMYYIVIYIFFIGDMVGNDRWHSGANYHFDLGYVSDGLE